jgi:hypothetical protein
MIAIRGIPDGISRSFIPPEYGKRCNDEMLRETNIGARPARAA